MRFLPTEEQKMFRSAVTSVLTKTSTPADVRAAWGVDRAGDTELWKGLEATGFLSLLAPEELGGGGSELEFISALDAVGLACAPGPIVEHAAIAVPLLGALDPMLLEGLLEQGAVLTATDSDVVPYARDADGIVVLQPDRVLYLAMKDSGIGQDSPAFDGSRSVARLGPDALSRAIVVAEGERAAREIRLSSCRATLGTAAVLVGLSTKLLGITVDYASMRTQFGVPIGSFQAVKHHLANAYIEIEFARPLVEAAAWALSEGAEDQSRLCSMAKVKANAGARRSAKAALQCHGAIGYTMEADLHLYMARVWSLLNAWGGTDHHRERVALSILGEAS
ncbi:acyl-CoA dehydrogenase family protein [Specibacter sp. RAF43]|uniref:acyl-CoA dehydrogenase family protein n=1 Tax=Specibacter sp. RAF43 TaxID=3233057 RepID=UPI003F9B2DE1